MITSFILSLFRSLAELWERYGVVVSSILSFLLFSTAMTLALLYTPLFSTQEFGGLAQKIMYLHIPFAIISFIAFLCGCGLAITFLVTDQKTYDDLSRACVESGFVLSIGVLLSGPLWAKPVWGVWWSFEPRLNTFLIMWTLYAVYFLIPPFLDRKEMKEKFRSVMAILGFLTVPMVYYSVDLIAARYQNHPQRDLEMEPSMVWTIRLTMAALFLLFLCLSWTRYRLFRIRRTLYKQITRGRS